MTESFPELATAFYTKRDDRTNRCVSDRAYQSVGCVVSADPTALETPTGQVLFVAACNLLSRWCRRVELLLTDTDPPTLEPGPSAPDENLYGSILALMHDADPFGAFDVVVKASGNCRLQLHVGPQPTRFAEHLVVATAHGWDAGLATNTDPLLEFACDGNVLGAIGSACITGAQLFKLAVGHGLLIKDGVFDLFRLQRVGSPAVVLDRPQFGRDVGRLLLIGAGSVGSAAVYFMRMAGLTADVDIVERDSVKIENFNRSPIFGKKTYALNKGRALQQFLQGTSITVANVFEVWWDEFIRQRGRNGYDIWLPLANEFGVRWSIQNNFPPLMVHASSGANWNANFGRHIPLLDDCLVDRFPENASDTALACATGEVTTTTERTDAALPFLSFFAGFLVTAELCRLNAPGYPQQVPNYALFDFGGPIPMEKIQAWNRKPAETCLCKKQSSTLYRQLNGNTRFAHLIPV